MGLGAVPRHNESAVTEVPSLETSERRPVGAPLVSPVVPVSLLALVARGAVPLTLPVQEVSVPHTRALRFLLGVLVWLPTGSVALCLSKL